MEIGQLSMQLVDELPSGYLRGVRPPRRGPERKRGLRLRVGAPAIASGYAPGQEMQAKGSKSGSPGASGYAPGQTTGSNTKSKK